MAWLSTDYQDFFTELRENNHKEWFDSNRSRYEKSVKRPFAKLVDRMIELLREQDPSIQIQAKDAIFRINRDIRFSEDKSPYKTHMGAVISPRGRKDKGYPGFYMQLNDEGIMLAGGAYMPDKGQVQRMRENLAANAGAFEKVIAAEAFSSLWGEIRGESNKRLPKELAAAAASNPLIAMKQWYFMVELEPSHVLSDELDELLISYFRAAHPVNQFLITTFYEN